MAIVGNAGKNGERKMIRPRITDSLKGSLGELYYKELCDQTGWAYISLENIHKSENYDILEFKKGFNRVQVRIPSQIKSEIQKIATETFEYFTRKNMEAFTSMFDNTTKKVQSLAEIKKAEDFAKFCTDCAKEASEAAVAFSKEAINDSVSVSKKYSTVIEKSVKESVTV